MTRIATADSKASQQSRLQWLAKNALKPVVFVVALMPLAYWIYAVLNGELGANPIEALEKESGEFALRLLLLSLLATPLTAVFKIAWPVRLRRMIGLFAFFYASVHLAIYVGLDQQLSLKYILEDLIEKPFITVGFAALLMMFPLAITSNRFSVRKLGKRWKALHNWVYYVAILALLHYVWLAKGERLEPVVYLVMLLVLLGYRLVRLVL